MGKDVANMFTNSDRDGNTPLHMCMSNMDDQAHDNESEHEGVSESDESSDDDKESTTSRSHSDEKDDFSGSPNQDSYTFLPHVESGF
jgi:hypothetical protein